MDRKYKEPTASSVNITTNSYILELKNKVHVPFLLASAKDAQSSMHQASQTQSKQHHA